MEAADPVSAILAELPTGGPVREVHSWSFVTAVRIDRWGIASSRPGDPDGRHAAGVRGAGDLVGREAAEVAALMGSRRTIEAAIGAATANALLPAPTGPDRNVLEVLEHRMRDARVAMVGGFPFARRLAESAERVDVIELRPGPGEIPWADSGPVLGASDWVCCSGATLTNHTLRQVMRKASDARIALVGPTVPAAASLLDCGISLLAGTTVTEPDRCLPIFREGGVHRRTPGLRRWVLEDS